MNRIIILGILALTTLSFPVQSAAKKGGALVYEKTDGEISISQVQNHPCQAKFEIITNMDARTCNAEGI